MLVKPFLWTEEVLLEVSVSIWNFLFPFYSCFGAISQAKLAIFCMVESTWNQLTWPQAAALGIETPLVEETHQPGVAPILFLPWPSKQFHFPFGHGTFLDDLSPWAGETPNRAVCSFRCTNIPNWSFTGRLGSQLQVVAFQMNDLWFLYWRSVVITSYTVYEQRRQQRLCLPERL